MEVNGAANHLRDCNATTVGASSIGDTPQEAAADDEGQQQRGPVLKQRRHESRQQIAAKLRLSDQKESQNWENEGQKSRRKRIPDADFKRQKEVKFLAAARSVSNVQTYRQWQVKTPTAKV